jgi:trehalose-phosphatase
LQPIPGAWVEEKGLTLSIHWRHVPRTTRRTFHRVVAQCTAPYLKQHAIQITKGKRVIEVRPPVRWDKGTSIAWLLSRLGGSHGHSRSLVMYFGDDQTDEDAFRMVNGLRGFSVLVGRPVPRSAARYWLRDAQGVKTWLATLRQARQRPRMNGRRATHGLATACC